MNNKKLCEMITEVGWRCLLPNPKELTRADVVRAADKFRWTRKGAKWTVTIGERELPARPLVLEAAGVPPNDPTNSHQAVEILRRLGFETRYAKEQPQGSPQQEEESSQVGKGLSSILEIVSAATREVPDSACKRLPTDLAKNVDHYLYGTKKKDE